jgi:hypothetical protein
VTSIPQKPVPPEPEDCCRSGCIPCVFDLYEEELARYEAWLAGQDKAGAKPEGQ